MFCCRQDVYGGTTIDCCRGDDPASAGLTLTCMLAAQRGDWLALLDQLVAQKSSPVSLDFSYTNTYGHTILYICVLAAGSEMSEEKKKILYRVIDTTLSFNVDPNVQNGSFGETILIRAAATGNAEVTLKILGGKKKRRLNGNSKTQRRKSGRKEDRIPVDLEIRTHRNPRNSSGRRISSLTAGFTALLMASYMGHLNIVMILVDAGANIHATCPFGRTALLIALERNHKEIERYLASILQKENQRKQKGVNLANERESSHSSLADEENLTSDGSGESSEGVEILEDDDNETGESSEGVEILDEDEDPSSSYETGESSDSVEVLENKSTDTISVFSEGDNLSDSFYYQSGKK
eukprot:g4937.t1